MSELSVMDRTGDTKVIWDKNNDDEVENARATFTRLTGKGYMAFKVKKDGERGVQIFAFDADAEKIILVPPVVGG